MCPFVKNAGLVVSMLNSAPSVYPVGLKSTVQSTPVDPTTSWPPIDYGPAVQTTVVCGDHTKDLDE